MRSRVLTALLAPAAFLAMAAPALATTRTVHPGQAIQPVIDASSPGDTVKVLPGKYAGGLLIATDHLSLIGAPGGSDKRPILVPPPHSTPPNLCTQFTQDVNGICVLGHTDGSGNLVAPVVGVTVRGFDVRNFPSVGIFNIGADGTRISRNRLVGNGGYGVFTNTSTNTIVTYNYAKGSGEAGFYVGDSPNSNAIVQNNQSTDNSDGFFFRDASYGTATHNNAWGNCVGILALDTDSPTAPDHWTIAHNNLWANDKSCPPSDDGGPPLSGLGMALIGLTNSTVFDNHVWNNAPSGPSFVSAGIALLSGTIAGGGDEMNDVFSHNTVQNNTSLDFFWDGVGTGIVFTGNHCATSDPSSICA